METLQLQADTLNHSVLDKTKLADLEKLAYNPDLDHLQKVLKEIDYEALPKQELEALNNQLLTLYWRKLVS